MARPKKVKKIEQLEQVHAALPPVVDMNKLFGIKDTYNAKTVEEYSNELDAMGRADLWEHSHRVGIIPMEPLDKLKTALKRKFVEVQRNSFQPRTFPTKINPKMKEFHEKFMKGDL